MSIETQPTHTRTRRIALPDIYGWLSALNPLWFIFSYAIVLLAFGYLYYRLPVHSFYAPYARFEPSAHSDAAVLIDDIERALRRPERKSFAEMGFEWSIKPDLIQVSSMTNSGADRLAFNVSYFATAVAPNNKGRATSGSNFDVSISLNPEFSSISQRESHYFHHVNGAGFSPGKESAAFRELFRSADGTLSGLEPVVDFDDIGQAHLRAFIVGLSGEPTQISGLFGRMLYLSATTITTTGFGDIVPLSGTARLLCGAEAVLGWLFAGFFLNAAAWRASQRNTNFTKTDGPA